MPTDLERQLPRFAEALDREAPAISVDEILGRGTVVVDVDALERPSWDQAARIDVSWSQAMPGHGENGERGASIQLAPMSAQPPARRRVGLRIALAAAAACGITSRGRTAGAVVEAVFRGAINRLISGGVRGPRR